MTKEIPSPPTLPILGNLLNIMHATGSGEDARDAGPIKALERLADQYGPIYKLQLNGQERIVCASYDLFEELCDETRFYKTPGPALQSLRTELPPGLFVAPTENHPDWRQAHRILMPAFGPLAIRNMFDEMHDVASQLVLKWARRGPEYKIAVTEDFTRLTLDTIALCAMDFRFNSFYHDEMHPFVSAMLGVLSSGLRRQRTPKLIQKFQWSENEQLAKDSSYLKEVSKNIVRHRRENASDKKDLLNAMLNGKDPKTGEGMRDDLIASNMITFLIAGHETTSGLLSFAFHNMLKNPVTYFKAQQEVDRVIGRGKITVDHLKDFPYINAILRETLRLTPTAPAFTRGVRPENKEDIPIVGGYKIKREWSVLCLIAKIQKDPKIYGEDANEFRPERMLDEEFNKLPKAAWKPFGTGMRACIGRPFAWQEALLVTALLLQNFDFKMDDPNYKMRIKSNLTIKPKGFYMRASLREGITPITLQHTLSASKDDGEKYTNVSNSAQPAEELSGKPMTILYGSNTGTCQSFAQKLATDARIYGYQASVKDMDSGASILPTDQPVAIITASYEGQPPDNAAQFVAWLESMEEGQPLKGVSFSVFGCGHKDWASTFHRIPKLVDNALEKLGGERYVERGSSDGSQGDMFSDFDQWAETKFWPAILSKFGAGDALGNTQEIQVNMEISTTTRASQLQHDVEQGKVTAAKVLTAPGEPEKRQLDVKLPEGMEYEAGDYLAVLPLNPDGSVRRVLKRYSLPWDAVVTIKAGGPVTLPANQAVSAFDLLKGFVELSLPATRKNIQTLKGFTSDPETLVTLEILSGSNYHTEIITKRLSILDILDLHAAINLPFPEFLAMLPPMRPRHYSISSSPLKDPTTCSITYGVINATSLAGTGRFQGVAGTYLSSLCSGDAISVSVRSATRAFHLPADPSTTPIIMFCNGTGLAPFRSFVQERATQIASNPHIALAPAILFIGCRAKSADSIYAEDFAQWAKAGAVDIRYAFSREPSHPEAAGCKYVQDRMLRDKKDVFELWDNGAKVFLCGSPGMVEGIKRTARVLVEERRGVMGKDVGEDQVEGFFRSMRNERIAVDVFA
ncbi:fatty acid hydroxylase [Lindgomyces ingoldianus]|uniref:Fatty acid hydroxylase n=1 Tax=Lindgomyces ingoldianus TaxID=673940 RepID=A0ACB6QY30_9PLEO|nr:fatty acid hydroxylase [Lindgomyces ingoldianus]KAF2471722.1 fatty acid hydroxylase [Lindgomyces ingoldianus]